jgi:formylmethanofuran dehydrogenase subunit E
MMEVDSEAQVFESLLEESVKAHGHLCPGQILGVRLARLGLEKLGIKDPKGKDRKNLIVFVEMDRCATDAISSVTGCSLGRRTMKFMDYGKMAASFMNLRTERTIRIVVREDSREKAKIYFPGMADKAQAQLEAYRVMSDDELFEVKQIRVIIKSEDMPGRPLSRVQCTRCGEYVQDMREIIRDGKILCRPCAYGGYYVTDNRKDFFSETVMQKDHNGLDIRSKFWIEASGKPIFGQGRMFLLEAIDRLGSISQAAQAMNISYRKAWSHINAMEERLQIRLIERRSGGKDGGGAALTIDAIAFLRKYRKLEESIKEVVDERFRQAFQINHDEKGNF